MTDKEKSDGICDGRKVRDYRLLGAPFVWTENPALLFFDFLTNSDYGLGYPVTGEDVEKVIALANVCDEKVKQP